MNKVLQQAALQWRYIEEATGQTGLEDWWWAWSQDYFQAVQDFGQGWAVDAIRTAIGPYTNARAAGKNLATYAELVQALAYFTNKIPRMAMTAITVVKNPSASTLDEL